MELKDRKALVVGLARTGAAAARFLAARGAPVTVSELKPESAGAAHAPPPPALAKARGKGIEIISELELAWRFLRGTVVAVTGSNGKTTTTALLGKIFG